MSGKSDAIDAKAESQSGNVDDLAGACPLQKALEDKHTLDLLCELQNSQPAAGLPYKVTVVADGSVHTGVLGSDGAAKLSDLPASEVEAEFGEAPDEAAISAARGQIASALEGILKEEREDAAKRDEAFSKLNILQKKAELENRVVKGVFDAGVGMLEFLDNVLELVSPTEMLNRAIKTSWESYNTETDDWKSDFIKNFDKSNHDALVKALGFDPNMVTPELIAEAQEIASFVYEDAETQAILASFAKEFATSQHITELAEFAGGGAFEIVLAALLASATGGVGAAGMAVSKVRLMPKLAKLGELLRNLAKQLKKKYRFIKKKGSTNGSVEAKLNKPESVEAAAPLNRELNLSREQLSEVDSSDSLEASMLPPPSKGMMQRVVDSIAKGDPDYVHKHWGDLNKNEYDAVRSYMSRTDAGKKLLEALDKREVFVDFTDEYVKSPYIAGQTAGRFGKVFLRNTENGYYWDQLDIAVDGMERTALIGLHEGLHAMGVGGSRRAEALVRLEELRSKGVKIDRAAIKQVLSDMDDSYDHRPWLSGGRSSKYFPELKF
ncbi:hypothetical protein ONV78_10470 [Hahella sp. CR1]|uniref:hypothetical protein n=1 Tax=Hahella sp. CR1 TaxID=2992807 RepID=UPI0024412F74|nr:hypothetical protein [Hahella sp. CR1]MDG9668158.1 hypothetical protein [Hahella sp. CR1]